MKHSLLPALAVAAVFSAGFVLPASAMVRTADGNQSNESAQPVTDSWITTKVKAELLTTDGVRSADISVDTKDGVVTLTGVLGNDVAIKKAIAAAESIKGVKRVEASGLKAKG